MPFKMTEAQEVELRELYNSFPDPLVGNNLDYVELYDKFLSFVNEYKQTNTLDIEEEKTVLWIEGAIIVNRDIGAQSDFIRDYNDAQNQLRYNVAVTDSQMNQVSDEIVITVIDQILSGSLDTQPGMLLSIATIAKKDAEPAAQVLFQNEINPGGWAGNPLFLFLGYDGAYQDNILRDDGDTYDLFAMIKVMKDLESGTNYQDLFDLMLDVGSTVYAANAYSTAVNTITLSDDYLDRAAFFWKKVKGLALKAHLKMQVSGINERFWFYRYDVGQKFDWHKDGPYTRDSGEKSLFTLLVYLNEDYVGGATTFSSRNTPLGFSNFKIVPPKRKSTFILPSYHS